MSVSKYLWTEDCESKYCIGECDLCDEWRDDDMDDYEIEADGFVTREEDLMVEEPHFAPGFQRKDKPYLEGYARGLEVAMSFCDTEQDSRAVKMQIEKIKNVLKNEAEWLY